MGTTLQKCRKREISFHLRHFTIYTMLPLRLTFQSAVRQPFYHFYLIISLAVLFEIRASPPSTASFRIIASPT